MRTRVTASVVPAARSDGLLIEPVGDETVIYDTRSKEAHCLKPLAAIVFERSDGHATVGEIARDRRAATRRRRQRCRRRRCRGPARESRPPPDPARGPRRWWARGDERPWRLAPRDASPRRVRGAAAAAGTSLVTSIVAPNAFAVSGLPAGCTGCTGNPDCLSRHCCQTNRGKSCNQSCCAAVNNSCHIRACTCSINGASCLARDCGPAEGNCMCICTVCASEVTGGQCPTCPPPSTSCCSNLVGLRNDPFLEPPLP